MSDVIYFAKKHDGVILPSKRDEDGGYDIFADIPKDEYVKIDPFENELIPTGLYSAFDKKYRVVFQERGSTGTRNMKVNAGLIDSGYRGEWFVCLYNANPFPLYLYTNYETLPMSTIGENILVYDIKKAICQAKIQEVPVVDVLEISYENLLLIKSERGDGMLGSSGK